MRSIYACLLAKLFSVLGSSISIVAIPLLLLDYTGSALLAGLVFSTKIIPILFSIVLGPRVLASFNSKRILVVGDVICCVAFLCLVFTGDIGLGFFAIIVLVLSIETGVDQVGGAAFSGLVPRLARGSGGKYGVEKLNGVVSSINNFGDIVGPMLGAFIVYSVGVQQALFIDALSFLVSSILIYFFLDYRSLKSVESGQDLAPDMSLIGGYKFIFMNGSVRRVCILSMAVNALIFPLLVLVIPVFSLGEANRSIVLGSMMSAFGIGAFLSSVGFSWVGSRLNLYVAMQVSSLLMVVLFFLAAMYSNVWFFLVIVFFLGLAVGFMGPLDDTILQAACPSSLLEQVFLAYSTMRFVTVPFGMLIFGVVLEYLSFSYVFVFMGLSLLPALFYFYSYKDVVEKVR